MRRARSIYKRGSTTFGLIVRPGGSSFFLVRIEARGIFGLCKGLDGNEGGSGIVGSGIVGSGGEGSGEGSSELGLISIGAFQCLKKL